MEILESAMAFAVAMIIFSTIATGIVEILVRVAGLRESNLRQTVESLFERIIWPRLKDRLAQAGTKAMATMAERRTEFVGLMTANPAQPGSSGAKLWPLLLHSGAVEMLTTMAFAERLGRTDVAKAILAEGEDQVQLLVRDFARSYERFGRASREVFKKRARATSILVGICLALAGNIDAGRLLNRMIADPDLRAGLIAQAEAAAAASRLAAESLEQVNRMVELGKLDGDQADTIRQQVAGLLTGLSSARDQGLPIGWSYFPYCSTFPGDTRVASDRAAAAPPAAQTRSGSPEGLDPACRKMAEAGGFWRGVDQHFLDYLRWFLLAVTAGVLIGLGGPFWFRVFTSLSQVFQLLRNLNVGGKGRAEADRPADDTTTGEAVAPADVLDAFRTAAAVHLRAASAGKAIRQLLGPDGQPI